MKVTIQKLQQWKKEKRPIVSLTAWDYAIAKLLDIAGIDLILVGDSLGMVALGYENTLPVTLDEMIHHTKAVCRGVNNAFVVCDLPFLTYQTNITQAIESAGKVMKETKAGAVKLEGGYPSMIETVSRLTEIGIPVMAHVGLTPQSVKILGYKQQGKTPDKAEKIFNQAMALEKAGAFAIVLEHITEDLAIRITENLSIPTIGIGAGNRCDGQVLVTADLLGLSEKLPPFAISYANLRTVILDSVTHFSEDVKSGDFPHEKV
ncbi:MAG: 3-methyl-2-oxobutanoate hydroxymethyltransferase [Cyanobacteria bacterium]|nr:3-methyl-2-oxobutanoate hydroxymethyltransferase [Cyanobacteria bacterium CG_2015-16_32_12]NCO79606.1 3-methyl-2-oxobutanoate hydroxymethyltransferase [Cyanobacteria bacterium CG_2015-22_32_23]NCQ04603.1 3-methyl-2-oxobutanoate hydroxymethyltransferase [Cyanobacteria bacterium CG_2015-09_32_10]NCQ41152.1 3-methyl-2-oxobutanoate hydroxymethyltransferase [Cyanobacteria bacterium CG_2015-04_32_10]NCS85538.1 3-methyl-2-oxobutanoate hydroxymethyltransferase [Cyanobacteria bacterium CG_2015-02_32_